MKTEISSCKTFGGKSLAAMGGAGASSNLFYPKPMNRDTSIDALLNLRTGSDWM